MDSTDSGADDPLTGVFLDIDDLQRNLDGLTEAVAQLRVEVDELLATPQARPKIWWWPDLTADEAFDAWATLTDWMRDHLVPRYPEVDRALQPCWPGHPDAVDALTSLYATWRVAYQIGRDPVGAATWLNQWLPAAIAQLKQSLRQCNRSDHKDDTARRQDMSRLFEGPIAEFIATDVANRQTPNG